MLLLPDVLGIKLPKGTLFIFRSVLIMIQIAKVVLALSAGVMRSWPHDHLLQLPPHLQKTVQHPNRSHQSGREKNVFLAGVGSLNSLAGGQSQTE